ncbi:MAG: AI-2E family transporter [Rhodocyclaceae bacterium]|nr:AI-2E family transporter [Rhodocyclaceae bacterium]
MSEAIASGESAQRAAVNAPDDARPGPQPAPGQSVSEPPSAADTAGSRASGSAAQLAGPVLAAIERMPASLPATGLFVLALLVVVYFARPLLFPIVLAILLALMLAPAVRLLKLLHLPEAAGAALVMCGLLASVGTGLYYLADPAAEWVDRAPAMLREVEIKLRQIKKPVESVRRATEKVESLATVPVGPKTQEVVVKEAPLSAQLLRNTQSFAVGTISTLVLLYFLLASGDLFLRKLMRVAPSSDDSQRAVEVGRRIQQDIGRYFALLCGLNIALGCVITLATHLLGMPNPVLWGVLVGLLNFIPYLGPTLSLAMLTLAALVSFRSLSEALTVPAVFLAIEFLNGQIVHPLVAGRMLALNPVAIFIAFLFWGWMWGIAGMLIAAPLLVVLKVFCDHVDRLAFLAEFLSRD